MGDAYPDVNRSELAAVDREEMVEVDRVMIHDLGIALLQMMENAGRNLADLAIRRFDSRRIVVLAGSGGNGGGGMAAARHLFNRGRSVDVVLIKDVLTDAAAQQRDVLRRIGVRLHRQPVRLESADLIVDAMIGYSLAGPPRGSVANVIRKIRSLPIPVLALDTPSGLDVSSGEAFDPHVVATATMTLAAPKHGLIGHDSVGEHYLADISVPASVYATFGKTMGNPFAESTIVRIRG